MFVSEDFFLHKNYENNGPQTVGEEGFAYSL